MPVLKVQLRNSLNPIESNLESYKAADCDTIQQKALQATKIDSGRLPAYARLRQLPTIFIIDMHAISFSLMYQINDPIRSKRCAFQACGSEATFVTRRYVPKTLRDRLSL